MTSNDQDMHTDSEKVSQLYQQVSDELPSEDADLAIISLAKAALGKPKASKPIKRKIWRKWQWTSSIAASVLFVSVIVYTQYEQFNPQPRGFDSIPADPFSIADQSTFDAEIAAQKSELKTKEKTVVKPILSNKKSAIPEPQLIEELALDEPALSNFAEQEAQTLASTALDDIELDIDLNQFGYEQNTPVVTDIASQKNKAKALADISLAQLAKKDTSTRAEAEARAEARAKAVAGSEAERLAAQLKMSWHADLPLPEQALQTSDYLDDLFVKLERLLKGKNKSKKDRQAIDELRESIFDYLSLLKASEPQLTISPKYLAVLDQAQRDILNK